MASCPLAEYRHEKGYDSSPSFGTHIEDDGISFINCFTCKAKGTLPDLARQLARYRDDTELKEYATLLERQEIVGGTVDFGRWDEDAKASKAAPTDITNFPNEREFFARYPSVVSEPRAVAYLARRGIGWSAITALGLRYDPKQWRILFPVYDERTGRFAGSSGRSIRSNAYIAHRKELDKQKAERSNKKGRLSYPKIRDYHGLQKDRLILSNRRWIKEPPGPVLIVEGLMALARMVTIRPKLLHGAILGSALTLGKEALLRETDRPLYWMLDPDAAGMAGMYGTFDKELAEKLQYKYGEEYNPITDRSVYNPRKKPDQYGALDKLYGRLPQFTMQYPEGVDDADNVTGPQLDAMIKNADLYVRKALTKPKPRSIYGLSLRRQ